MNSEKNNKNNKNSEKKIVEMLDTNSQKIV